MLYSYKGEMPMHLPNKIRLSNGTTRTDKNTFTEEEIADAGWTFVGYPPETIFPNKVEWSGNQWIVREPNESEIQNKWNEVREMRDNIMKKADILVIRCIENGGPVPQSVLDYKNKLRDITLQEDPWNIVWPNNPQLIITDPVNVEEFK